MSIERQSLNRWLPIREAADYLGCNPQVLKRWIRSGLLKGEGVGKAGRDYRLQAKALDRFVELKAKRK